MKKIVSFLCSILFLIILFLNPTRADMGPKPSVNIRFLGAPNEPYFVTLLSEQEQYGPWHRVYPYTISDYAKEELEVKAYTKFVEYQDEDGFYFLNYVQNCNETNTFAWTYYPPSTFKVAVYCPSSDELMVSEITKRVAFDTYFEAQYGTQPLQLREEIKLEKKLLSFFVRVLLTIVVEVLLGWLFGYRQKKEMKTILIVNLVTQVLLNLVMLVLDYYSGWLVWIFIFPLLEIGICVIETIIYCMKFKEHSKAKTILYTVLANGITFVLGLYTSVIGLL